MDFRITSTGAFGDDTSEQHPCLKDYHFRKVEEWYVGRRPILDENGEMIFQEHRYTIDRYIISINSIEQLMSLIDAVESPLIVTKDEIEIYDCYRE